MYVPKYNLTCKSLRCTLHTFETSGLELILSSLLLVVLLYSPKTPARREAAFHSTGLGLRQFLCQVRYRSFGVGRGLWTWFEGHIVVRLGERVCFRVFAGRNLTTPCYVSRCLNRSSGTIYNSNSSAVSLGRIYAVSRETSSAVSTMSKNRPERSQTYPYALAPNTGRFSLCVTSFSSQFLHQCNPYYQCPHQCTHCVTNASLKLRKPSNHRRNSNARTRTSITVFL